MTDTSKLRETPETDAFMAQWVSEAHQCFDASIADFVRTIERRREELEWQLNIAMPVLSAANDREMRRAEMAERQRDELADMIRIAAPDNIEEWCDECCPGPCSECWVKDARVLLAKIEGERK